MPPPWLCLRRREQQIENFKQHNAFARLVPTDPSSYDIGLRLSNGDVITVRLTLPPTFPETRPIMSIIQRYATHPWLEPVSQTVIGSPDLNGWTPAKHLGPVGEAPSPLPAPLLRAPCLSSSVAFVCACAFPPDP